MLRFSLLSCLGSRDPECLWHPTARCGKLDINSHSSCSTAQLPWGLSSSTLVVRLSWICSPWVPWTDLHFLSYLCIFFTDGSKRLEIRLLPQVFLSGSEKGSKVYSSHGFICRKHRAQLYQRLFGHISRSSQNFCKSTLHSKRKLLDWALQVSAFTPLKLWGCLLAEEPRVEQLPIGYQMHS